MAKQASISRGTYLWLSGAWPPRAHLSGAVPPRTSTRRRRWAAASSGSRGKSWFCRRWWPLKSLQSSPRHPSADRSSSLRSGTTSSRWLCRQEVTGESARAVAVCHGSTEASSNKKARISASQRHTCGTVGEKNIPVFRTVCASNCDAAPLLADYMVTLHWQTCKKKTQQNQPRESIFHCCNAACIIFHLYNLTHPFWQTPTQWVFYLVLRSLNSWCLGKSPLLHFAAPEQDQKGKLEVAATNA